jgi:RNA polymerase sigma factor (TIGR02999 family)
MVEHDEPANPDRQLVTRLLQQWTNGNKSALNELMPLVYGQLRRLAAGCLGPDRHQHTLRATALVHEAYLRLVNAEVAFEDRVHFYAVAARVIRNILVDHAKAANRQKRGGGQAKMALDEAIVIGGEISPGIIELDEALQNLAIHDARKSDIVEMLFFGGMTYDETAVALGISPATVHRELRMAKAWIRRDLKQPSSG